MFGSKLKVSKELLDKCKLAAEKLSCSSVDEFVSTTLEKEADKIISQSNSNQESAEDMEGIKNKLKGLGYID